MDRFIVADPHTAKHHQKPLKSNMDRFIASEQKVNALLLSL